MNNFNKIFTCLFLTLTLIVSSFNVNYVAADPSDSGEGNNNLSGEVVDSETTNEDVTDSNDDNQDLVEDDDAASKPEEVLPESEAGTQDADTENEIMLLDADDETEDQPTSIEYTPSNCNGENGNKCILLSDANGLTFKINTETSSSSKLGNGDTLEFTVSYNFPKNEGYTFIVDLGEIKNIVFSDSVLSNTLQDNNHNVVGQYNIKTTEVTKDDGTKYNDTYLVITYNWEALKNTSEEGSTGYKSNFILSANIALDDDAIDTSTGIAKIAIGGYEFSVYCKYPDSSLQIKKTPSETNADVISEGKLYRNYNVAITSKDGNNTNVSLTDTLGSSDVEFINNETYPAILTINEDTKTLSENEFKVDGSTATVSIEKLDKDANATLSYWITYGISKAGDLKNAKNSAEATFTNNNGTPDQKAGPATSSLSLSAPTFKKEGAISSTSDDGSYEFVEWTTTITGATYNGGYKIFDAEKLTSNNADLTTTNFTPGDTVTLIRTKANEESSNTWKISYSSFVNGGLVLLNGYDNETSPSENVTNSLNIGLKLNDTLKIIYTNKYKVEGIDKSYGLRSDNTISYSNSELGILEENKTIAVTGVYHVVPGEYVSINKTYSSFDPLTNTITWKVDIKVPSSFSKFVYEDEYSSNQKFNKTTDLSCTPSEATCNVTIVNDTSFKVELSNGTEEDFTKTIDGTSYTWKVKHYVLTYTTTLDMTDTKVTPNNTTNIGKGSYEYLTFGRHDVAGTKTISKDLSLVIKKSGNTLGTTTGQQNWEVEINLEAINTKDNTKKFIIEDELPENMALISDSFTFDGIKVDVQTSSTDKGFSADLTKLIFDYKNDENNADKKTVKLSYNTEFINLKTAAEKGASNYTNVIKSKFGNDDGYVTDEDSGTLNCTFNPKDVLTKTFAYTSSDNTTAAYTITINPSAISVAPSGKDTYEITDILGTSLSYVHDKDTDKVATITADGNDITKQCEELVDDETNTLTISNIPDKKVITITYNCLINLAADTNANNLRDSAVGNSIEFNGADGLGFANSAKFNKVVNSTSKNSTVPENASISIIKVDKDDLKIKLKGAKFRIYAVKIEDGEFVELTNEEVSEITGNPKSKTVTTDENGEAKVTSLVLDQLYCVEETSAPSGYENEEYKLYVLFDGNNYNDNVDIESLIPEGTNFKHIYNYIASLNLTVKNTKSNNNDKKDDSGDNNNNNKVDNNTGANTNNNSNNNESSKSESTNQNYSSSNDWIWNKESKTYVYKVSNTNSR